MNDYITQSSDNLKVCFLMPTATIAFTENNELKRSGAEVQMAMVAQYLSQRGFNIEAICQDEKHIDHHGSNFADCKLLPSLPHANTVNLALRYFIHIIRNTADIYITRIMSPLLPVYRMATVLINKPLIFSCASQYDVAKQFKGRNLLQAIVPSCVSALKSCDRIVTQTEWQKSALIKNYEKDSTIIPNAIDLDYWKPSYSLRTRRVIWLGNIRPVKRFDRLIQIAEMCPDVVFTAIGGVSKEIEHIVESLPQNLHWVGRKGKNEVKQILQRSQILLNTSESEGFPNTILEARALGLFTIFFRIESLSIGFFEQPNLGRTVDTCTDASKAIYTYFEFNDDWKHRSRETILAWVKDYSIELIGQKWVKLIESMIKSN